ncbi:hypothetical protein PCANC_07330 [Puccinia coronata f. sp. avenae]|uniref:Uncharacterized protein n=1 Tax=Puccinia coronata f. sp. avenae TaxID=200324 RepID=A0A2N5T6H6_9BASI|nr:hypothetical protein PCANC_07330 [Puccinia coronata f. sp. avenae]
MPPPHFHTQTLNYMAVWHHLHLQQTLQERIYIRAPRQAFMRPPQWEPWNNNQPTSPISGAFPHDPLGQGQPLSVEAQVAVGLYRLGHGATYVTIVHVFSIGKETADKALGRFVIAVLKTFRKRAIK